MSKTCSGCRFFHVVRQDYPKRYECRRFPPIAIEANAYGGVWRRLQSSTDAANTASGLWFSV